VSSPLRLAPGAGADLQDVERAIRPDLEPLLTAEQVAAILGVRPKRVYELGIPCVHLSVRSLRYQRADVVSWIEGRRTGT